MAVTDEQAGGAMRRFWRNLVRQWIDLVPDELAGCEFECRKSDCARGEWEQCAHRLDVMRRTQSRSADSD
jgi:hypothetical protein